MFCSVILMIKIDHIRILILVVFNMYGRLYCALASVCAWVINLPKNSENATSFIKTKRDLCTIFCLTNEVLLMYLNFFRSEFIHFDHLISCFKSSLFWTFNSRERNLVFLNKCVSIKPKNMLSHISSKWICQFGYFAGRPNLFLSLTWLAFGCNCAT